MIIFDASIEALVVANMAWSLSNRVSALGSGYAKVEKRVKACCVLKGEVVYGAAVVRVRKGRNVGAIRKPHFWSAMFSDCAHKKSSTCSVVLVALREL